LTFDIKQILNKGLADNSFYTLANWKNQNSKFMKLTKILTLLFFGSLFFTSCRETVTEEKEVIKEVEVEREDEGVLERTAKKVDKEVNEEINEEIEKIGDDN
jgi:hypothetical protein